MVRHLTFLACLSLFAVSAGCTTTRRTSASAAEIQMFEVTGELTYRERMALPPQSVALVELRDVSVADAPSTVVTVQRIDLTGRQVPVPFRLAVERSNLSSGRRYSVRGIIIRPNKQVLWTATHPVDAAAEKAELGTLVMNRIAAGASAGESSKPSPR